MKVVELNGGREGVEWHELRSVTVEYFRGWLSLSLPPSLSISFPNELFMTSMAD